MTKEDLIAIEQRLASKMYESQAADQKRLEPYYKGFDDGITKTINEVKAVLRKE